MAVKYNSPKSFGMTLRAIRLAKGESQDDFGEVLKRIKSKFDPEPPTAPSKSRLSKWELGVNPVPFSYAHSYAELTETLVGVLYITSHFYAHIRDMHNPEKPEHNCEDAIEMADRLIAFAETAKTMMVEYGKTPLKYSDNGTPGEDHQKDLHCKEVIWRLIEGYSEIRPNNKDNGVLD